MTVFSCNLYILNFQRANAAQLRILHFTDIHYDDIYKVGGNALCDDPLCCGNNQGEPANAAAAAGAWGDYRYCDTPWHAVLDLMNRTSKEVSSSPIIEIT